MTKFKFAFYITLLAWLSSTSSINAEKPSAPANKPINWQLLRTLGEKPEPRGGGKWIPIGTKIVAIGGFWACVDKSKPDCQQMFYDTVFVFDVSTNRWEKKDPAAHSSAIPSRRAYLAGAPYTKNKTAIIFGGLYYDTKPSDTTKTVLLKVFDDMWEYNPTSDTFTKRIYTNRGPGPRAGASIVIKNDILYLFGGFDNKSTYHNDVWAYNLLKNAWQQIRSDQDNSSSPSRRYLSMSDLSPSGDDIYLYGGEYIEDNKTVLLGDLWKYNIAANHFSELLPENRSSMKSRVNAAMAMFADHLIIALGNINFQQCPKMTGTNYQDPTNEVWAININKDNPDYQWKKITIGTSPPALNGIISATVSGKLYITSGFDWQCNGSPPTLTYNQNTYSLALDQINP